MKLEDNSIRFFRRKNTFLSNFYLVTVRYEGMNFPSVEAAFQAAKSWDVRHRLACSQSSAKDAKALGRKKLLATGDAALVEGNQHGDRF